MQISRTHRLGYPFQKLFVPVSLVSFTLALATDVVFWQTADLMWQNFSAWLLFAGLVGGALAVIAAIIDLIRPETRALRASVLEVLGFIVALLLALINSFVHAGDGWIAVVPLGLALSGATFVVILLTLVFAARAARTSNWSAQ
ncbi:hypothetical protein LJR098_003490 [Rhizobium sp. LjRoot98]|uniref:DUF2231 domain-containing protein n=1 Tax=Rhizobium sp. LjRoot98 TaxID=3342345 RepID=UPI003ED06178